MHTYILKTSAFRLKKMLSLIAYENCIGERFLAFKRMGTTFGATEKCTVQAFQERKYK